MLSNSHMLREIYVYNRVIVSVFRFHFAGWRVSNKNETTNGGWNNASPLEFKNRVIKLWQQYFCSELATRSTKKDSIGETTDRSWHKIEQLQGENPAPLGEEPRAIKLTIFIALPPSSLQTSPPRNYNPILFSSRRRDLRFLESGAKSR